MKQFLFLFAFVFFVSNAAFSQEKTIKHKVEKGETVTNIALKYNVTPNDIYKLNPDSKAGIKLDDILLIPTKENVVSCNVESLNSKIHTVLPKETVFSIARDFNVEVDDLKKLNEEFLKDGLKIGQTIKIPSKRNSQEPIVTKANKTIYHTVAPKETKFGISKLYNITVQDLEKYNPDIVNGLQVGQKLIVKISSTIAEEPKVIVPVKKEVKVTEPSKVTYTSYEVKPQDTFFSLSQLFDISKDELIALNPTLDDGVKTGMILKVPGKASIIKLSENNSSVQNLIRTKNTRDKKSLILLLPFNANKIQADTTKTASARLKKDAFLNMTLDFYSGALMAIDSAKVLGLNIDVKIFDTEETKTSSAIEGLLRNKNFKEADAIIGPFYQQNVEKFADFLKDKNIPVISPLSKELGAPYSNLFQAMPPSEYSKQVMLDYMMSKNGNIILVSDPKKQTNKEYISKNYPSVVLASVSDAGGIDLAMFRSLFVKDRINYVIFDTEKTGMILSATNIMLNMKGNIQTQMVILEPNTTLDFEEISMKRLTVLKLLYPSITRENNTDEAVTFDSKYKEEYKILPNQFAIRGFDVTFDTMLRISQDKSFTELSDNVKTEQIQNRFDYRKKAVDGYTNNGVYIMEFQDDLSVKQVN
jgi:LysM repeat protein